MSLPLKPTHRVTILHRDGHPIWSGYAEVYISEHGVTVNVDAPLELVPGNVPFVRLPKEDPDA